MKRIQLKEEELDLLLKSLEGQIKHLEQVSFAREVSLHKDRLKAVHQTLIKQA